MKTSKTGKPLCSQCRRLATYTGNYYRSQGKPAHLYYCATHAEHVRDALPLVDQGKQSSKPLRVSAHFQRMMDSLLIEENRE